MAASICAPPAPPEPPWCSAPPAACTWAASSAASRVFPIPAGPERNSTRPRPRATCRQVPRSHLSSRSRSASGVPSSSSGGSASGAAARGWASTASCVPCASNSSTGRSKPFSSTAPRDSNTTCSGAPAASASCVVTSTWPAAAFEHRRAAMFSATPRKPSSTGIASPQSTPMPTGSGSSGSSLVASRHASWNSSAARTACGADSNTASASSPRSSITRPPRASTASRASSANLVARRAAVSSPRSRVKVE